MKQSDEKEATIEHPVALPRENPFRSMATMLRGSARRIPGHLVIVFAAALSIAVLCGILLTYVESRDTGRKEYLAMTLSPDKGKPPLADAILNGLWVHEAGPFTTSLRIKNGVFEMVTRISDLPYTRLFVRGGYRYDGDVLILQQRKDLGTPLDYKDLTIRYRPMNFSRVNLRVESNGARMTWRTPEKEAARLRGREEPLKRIFGEDAVWRRIALEP